MKSTQSNIDSKVLNINWDVPTQKNQVLVEKDFIIYVTKLIEEHLANVIQMIAVQKLKDEPDLNKLSVSLELIKGLVKEIHFKLPDSLDNGHTFGHIPIFEDEEVRLIQLHKVLTLNSTN